MADRNPLLTRHAEALDLFGDRVHSVRDDHWDDPTPCTDWTVRDLVSHLVSEQLWVPAMVRDGATVEAIGGHLRRRRAGLRSGRLLGHVGPGVA